MDYETTQQTTNKIPGSVRDGDAQEVSQQDYLRVQGCHLRYKFHGKHASCQKQIQSKRPSQVFIIKLLHVWRGSTWHLYIILKLVFINTKIYNCSEL